MPFYDEGRYQCKIVSQAFGESKTKKTPFFALTIVPIAYFHAGLPEPEPVRQEERTVYLYFTEKTMESVCRDLRSLGFVGDKFSELDPDNPDHQSLVDQTAEFYCKIESYKDDKGTERSGEKWQLAFSGVRIAPLDTKGKRQLDALFGKHLKAAPKPSKSQTDSRPALVKQGVVEASGDDIPF